MGESLLVGSSSFLARLGRGVSTGQDVDEELSIRFRDAPKPDMENLEDLEIPGGRGEEDQKRFKIIHSAMGDGTNLT